MRSACRDFNSSRNSGERDGAIAADRRDPAMRILRNTRALLRGDVDQIVQLVVSPGVEWPLQSTVVVLLGSGLYGLTVGLWRSPVQSVFTAIKIPLLVLLACAGNAALNGMLAQLLGSGLSLRQTTIAIVSSFAAASVVLAALSPVALFILLNTPRLDAANAVTGHSVMLLTHVLFIAYAGIAANRLLLRLLQNVSPGNAAVHVFFGWLAGNFLLGSQLAWILRPFIGSPRIPVEFLRSDPLRGNFYEAVARAVSHLLS